MADKEMTEMEEAEALYNSIKAIAKNNIEDPVRIRRRIEDRLRKTGDNQFLLGLARILKCKID